MNDNASDDRPSDWNADRDKVQLECIGSFYAYTQDGERHTIEIWTHFGEKHDRDLRRVSPTQLVLTTTEGYNVDRVAQGEYRMVDNPEISLSTDDPNAP